MDDHFTLNFLNGIMLHMPQFLVICTQGTPECKTIYMLYRVTHGEAHFTLTFPIILACMCVFVLYVCRTIQTHKL